MPHSPRSEPAQRPSRPGAGIGARPAADRVVAAIVQRVVRDVVGRDVTPHVALGPVGQRVDLPQAVLAVPVELGRVGAIAGVLAAQPGHPGALAGQVIAQRAHLAQVAAAVGGLLPVTLHAQATDALDADVVARLQRRPRRARLGKQRAGVQGEHGHAGIGAHDQVEDHRGLLLKGGGDHQPRVEACDRLGDQLLGGEVLEVVGRGLDGGHQTAHSPSPRCTTNGAFFDQSMNMLIVSSENSTGMARSRTSSSKAVVPTRWANALKTSPSSRWAS